MRKLPTQDITEYYMRQVYLTVDVDDICEKLESFKSDITGADEYFKDKKEEVMALQAVSGIRIQCNVY